MRKHSKPALQNATKADAARKVGRASFVGIGTLALMLVVSGAFAAGGVAAEARALYQKERAACLNGESRQDRATCLQEAGAALRASLDGSLNNAAVDERTRNAMVRCDALPAEDRVACLRRMRGEGVIKGSAADGGIYRELNVTVGAQPENQVPAAGLRPNSK